jgi:hypothetical protein
MPTNPYALIVDTELSRKPASKHLLTDAEMLDVQKKVFGVADRIEIVYVHDWRTANDTTTVPAPGPTGSKEPSEADQYSERGPKVA